MKQFPLLLLLIWTAWCASCTPASKDHPHAMRMAEACMETSPDSAWTWLQGIADSIPHLPEEIQMHYHLLLLQAEDLLYDFHTSDSLVNSLVTYFDAQGEKPKRIQAYYLKGKVYADMHDAPQALEAYQQALDLAAGQSHWETTIYQEMYQLFANQGLHNDALRTNKHLLRIYEAQNNLSQTALIQRNMARLFHQKEEKDSALYYFRQAGHSALAVADSATYYEMLAEQASILYETEGTKQAFPLLEKTAHREDILDKSNIHFLLSQIYADREQWDSAHYYNLKVVESGNIEKTYYSYRNLHALEKRKGNYTKALEYMEKALESRNLLQTIGQNEAVAQIHALYNYQHIADENADLRLSKEKQKNVILILTLLTVGILFAGFAFVAYQRKRSRQILERERKLKQLAEERYAKSQMAIQDNERKLEELTKLLAKAQAENDVRMSGSLEMEMKKLQLQNEEIRLSENEQQQRIASFKNSQLYKLIV
ncbi:MAG: hypothetical protein J6R05_00485, partial [Bacteroidaceae bacterium]|nr:hypothetical protein [Bacteroidaceae bacterium]